MKPFGLFLERELDPWEKYKWETLRALAKYSDMETDRAHRANLIERFGNDGEWLDN
jgi:hypothetical protein